MIIIKNNRGATLIVVLVLSAVALLISGGLIYMITEGTKISGMSKRYKTAYEAGKAGSEVMLQLIDARATPDLGSIAVVITDSNRLFREDTGKLYAASATWSSYAGYNAEFKTLTIDPTVPATFDVRFDLGVNPTYRIYAKIIDTVKGNTAEGTPGSGGLLHKHAVVASGLGGGSGEIQVAPYPFFYTIEILAMDANNPRERARLSVLYRY